MLATPLLYISKPSRRGEWKGEDGGRGLETSVASCILVPSVRQSNWCVLGLPRTLGSIKQLSPSCLCAYHCPQTLVQTCRERREWQGCPGPCWHRGNALCAMGMVALHPSSGGQLVSRSCNPHATMASIPGLLYCHVSVSVRKISSGKKFPYA